MHGELKFQEKYLMIILNKTTVNTLKNNQDIIAQRFLYLSIVFTILTTLPFMEWSYISNVWAISLVSFWLTLSSLIVAWIFKKRAYKLQSLLSGNQLLAQWTLSPEEKKEYVDYFYEQKKAKNRAILLLISIISTVIFGLFILFIDEGKLDMFSSLLGLLALLSLFALGMPIYYRNSNIKGDGNVLVGSKYAYLNGYFHNWDFPLSGLSSIKVIKKPFRGIHLIYYYTDKTLRHNEELFIPANKDIDLDELMKSLKRLNLK